MKLFLFLVSTAYIQLYRIYKAAFERRNRAIRKLTDLLIEALREINKTQLGNKNPEVTRSGRS